MLHVSQGETQFVQTLLIGVFPDPHEAVHVPPESRYGVVDVVKQLVQVTEFEQVDHGLTHVLHVVESKYDPEGHVEYH